MLTTIVVFFAILALLVLVHEMGHFLMAKRNGVPAEEFGFGFPPRIIGVYKNKKGKWRWVFGPKEIKEEIKEREETIYSINLIPLGGFVKIYGEDGGGGKDPKSFINQKIWPRFKILVAGVSMNFILAVVLFTGAFYLGLPEAIDADKKVEGGKIQVSLVAPESPAGNAGLIPGDEIMAIVAGGERTEIDSVSRLQELSKKNAGKVMKLEVSRAGNEELIILKIKPRVETPEDQGPLGIQIMQTVFTRYSILESFWLGIKTTINLIGMIGWFLFDLIRRLFTAQPISAEIAGPVGIAVMTGQVAQMGLAFILQFAAMLSVNLAIINLLPLPALDGGRILFLGIEKIKGSPVSRKVEGMVHAIGFIALLGLMALVTIKDFANFNIVEKVKNLF